jgi:hypothetical protein
MTKVILLIINSGTTSWTLIGVLQWFRHALTFPYPVVGISSALWHYDAYNIKSIILCVVLCGCENWSFPLKEKIHRGVFENWYWEKCLVMRGRKEKEGGENCAVKGFLTYTARHMLLWWSSVGGWDGRNMLACTGENSLSFGRKTRRKQTNWKT